MSAIDPRQVARELIDAYAARRVLAAPPASRPEGLDLAAAYRVESAIVDLRRAEGHAPVGLKVGFASKAVWRALKLDTVAWAHMYDDTVRTGTGAAGLDVAAHLTPKIEPEIVFKLKRALPGGTADAAAALDAVEWFAFGFEIIDCVYADWKFQPADWVASKGLHARLIVGEPVPVTSESIPSLVDRLAAFSLALLKDGQVAAEGGGRNVLRNPALCLAELARAWHEQTGAPLPAGWLVSSGTLTDSQFIAPGQTWTVAIDGLDVPVVTLRTVAS